MPRGPFLSLAAAVAVLSIAPAAQAQHPHSVGRHLGIGWGDGYHAQTTCPPKILGFHKAAVVTPGGPAPWWKIPAAEPEPGYQPEPLPPSPAAGPSLFRQPGEGSSVTVTR